MTQFRELHRTGLVPGARMQVRAPTAPPYTHAEKPFARGRFATIHLVRRCHDLFLQSDLPGDTPNCPLAVKKIPRQGLTDLFLSPEDQVGMTAVEIERWSAEIGDLEFKMMKPLLRESVASRTLGRHPHILRYVESFWTNSHLYIISELAAGGDLQMRMSRKIESGRGPFTENELIPFIRVLCTTIAYIHRKGWTHGDVNPSNILFRDQSYDRLVVADFSSSLKVSEEDEPERTNAHSGMAGFRAPHGQLRGPPEDMWALGVTCYYLLTDRHPIHFNVNDKNDTAHQVEVEMINWEGFSPNGRDFMMRLIQFDPACRMTALEARGHPWLVARY